uniref:U4/U6 small nuclear ribonucleoprotein Prp31 n=1 Tax=Macrostomum lignano TaxID=282301 RepID=A0A1I8F9J8_9PLAT
LKMTRIRALSHVAHRRAPGRFGGDAAGRRRQTPSRRNRIDSEEFNNGDGADSAAAAAARFAAHEQLARVLGLEQIEAFEAGPEAAGQRKFKGRRSGPRIPAHCRGNNLAVKIDDEIHIIHRYATRFPELETLVPSPVEYLQTVQQLGNEPLEAVQVPGTLRPLPGSCHHHGGVGDRFNYSRRWQLIAPNLSAVVGASVAAIIAGLCGGLSALIRMPSCNIQAPPRASTAAICTMCAAVRSLWPRTSVSKAVRLIAAKWTPGRQGESRSRAPIDPPSKKRGGRRHRKMKERLGMTEIAKGSNRINFWRCSGRRLQEDLGFSLGNLGRSSSGRIRAPVADAKTKARVSKALAQKLQPATVSSVAFTPVQGLEIVNPRASERRSAEEEGANAKYFGTKSTFFHKNADELSTHGSPASVGPRLSSLAPRFQQQLEGNRRSREQRTGGPGFAPLESREGPRVVRDCRPGQVHSRVAVGPEHCSGVGALESERSADWKVAVTGSQKKRSPAVTGHHAGVAGFAQRSASEWSATPFLSLTDAPEKVKYSTSSGLGHEQPGGSGVDPVAGEVQRRHPVVEGGSVDRSAEADQWSPQTALCKGVTRWRRSGSRAVVPDEELRDAQVAVAAGGVQRRPAVDVAVFEFHAGVNQQLHRLDGGRTGGMEENLENVSPALPGRACTGDHR